MMASFERIVGCHREAAGLQMDVFLREIAIALGSTSKSTLETDPFILYFR